MPSLLFELSLVEVSPEKVVVNMCWKVGGLLHLLAAQGYSNELVLLLSKKVIVDMGWRWEPHFCSCGLLLNVIQALCAPLGGEQHKKELVVSWMLLSEFVLVTHCPGACGHGFGSW